MSASLVGSEMCIRDRSRSHNDDHGAHSRSFWGRQTVSGTSAEVLPIDALENRPMEHDMRRALHQSWKSS
eukprot:15415889-Alexandrium_andersonii.AAC.1